MKYLLNIFFLLNLLHASAQNLVSNGSFENYISCPTAQSGISIGNLVPGWGIPPGSVMTPDYFNSCYSGSTISCEYVGVPNNFGGNCNARTGVAYAGILAYYTAGAYNSKEYIQQQLISPMLSGQCYEIEFWIQIADKSGFSVSQIGAYVSETAPIQATNLQIEINPTINSFTQLDSINNWVKIHGDYLAQGGESFITIGNFHHDTLSNVQTETPSGSCILANQGAYYFIDDVVVQPCNGSYGFNEIICEGETITLYAYGSAQYQWVEATNLGIVLSTADSLIVNPSTNTTYLIYGDVDTTTITVDVISLPNVYLIEDTTICSSSTLLLEPSFENVESFWWQNGSVDSTFLVTQNGLYTISVSNSCGTVMKSVLVSEDSLELDALYDVSQCEEEPLTMSGYYPGATYLWSTGSTEPSILIQNSGQYWIQRSNVCGEYTDTFTVELINCESELVMPNVFSPNNDGNNDFFVPVKADNVIIKQFVVTNRWGNIVYYSEDVNVKWNGECMSSDCNDGTYFWVIIYTTLNGNQNTQQGFVQLNR